MFKPEAMIFDMDGLMVDSEPIQNLAFCWLVEREGKKLQLHTNGLVHTVGITERENVLELKKIYNLTGEIEELLEVRAQYYRELLKSKVLPMPGLFDLVSLIQKHGLPIAVASSSVPENIEIVLKRLNLDKKVPVAVSGTEVKRGKPAPDIFIKAADELGVSPRKCIVFEDAESGVRAGKEAGMKVVAVPSVYTKEHDFSLADEIVPSLEKITLEILLSLTK